MGLKILVTGAKGMLGSDLVSILGSKKEYELIGATRSDFDITDHFQTTQFLRENKPHIVVHTASYTKVDDCEKNREMAFNVNAKGAENVASGCKNINAKLIYISTDYIFNGNKNEPYVEDDRPEPLNVYGDSKLGGEQAVQNILNAFMIIRTSWLFGKKGNNFVSTILKQADVVKPPYHLSIVDDQVGSPTYTIDLSYAIEKLIAYNATGVFNITNSGYCSWYQFAQKILEYAGKKGVKVVPIQSGQLNRPARRPSYSILDCSKFKIIANYTTRHWEEALKDYLQNTD
jgi:dTDP-4-dehydrorhamnose reductase